VVLSVDFSRFRDIVCLFTTHSEKRSKKSDRFCRPSEHGLYSGVSCSQSVMQPQRAAPVLNLLLNHGPAFVIGELLLALSLGTFAVALVGALRDKYSVRVPVARTKERSSR
jgi:hypothetical protein